MENKNNKSEKISQLKFDADGKVIISVVESDGNFYCAKCGSIKDHDDDLCIKCYPDRMHYSKIEIEMNKNNTEVKN